MGRGARPGRAAGGDGDGAGAAGGHRRGHGRAGGRLPVRLPLRPRAEGGGAAGPRRRWRTGRCWAPSGATRRWRPRSWSTSPPGHPHGGGAVRLPAGRALRAQRRARFIEKRGPLKARGLELLYHVQLPEPEDTSPGARVPSRQLARFLERTLVHVAVVEEPHGSPKADPALLPRAGGGGQARSRATRWLRAFPGFGAFVDAARAGGAEGGRGGAGEAARRGRARPSRPSATRRWSGCGCR